MASGDMRKKPQTNFGVKGNQFPEPGRREFNMNTGNFDTIPAPPRATNVAPGTRGIQNKSEVNFGNTLARKNEDMTRLRQRKQGRPMDADDKRFLFDRDRQHGKYQGDS